MLRVLVVIVALALLGGAVQAADLASPDEVVQVDDAIVPTEIVFAVPARRVSVIAWAEQLVPHHLHIDSVFRPPRAVTFGSFVHPT